MTFGDDPFGIRNKPKGKGLSPLQLFIIYLIMWYVFAHRFF